MHNHGCVFPHYHPTGSFCQVGGHFKAQEMGDIGDCFSLDSCPTSSMPCDLQKIGCGFTQQCHHITGSMATLYITINTGIKTIPESPVPTP